MSSSEIEEKLQEIFRNVLREDVQKEISADEISSWDSLTHIKLIMTLEKAFGIRIPMDDVAALYSSFTQVADYLAKRIGGKK